MQKEKESKEKTDFMDQSYVKQSCPNCGTMFERMYIDSHQARCPMCVNGTERNG